MSGRYEPHNVYACEHIDIGMCVYIYTEVYYNLEVCYRWDLSNALFVSQTWICRLLIMCVYVRIYGEVY